MDATLPWFPLPARRGRVATLVEPSQLPSGAPGRDLVGTPCSIPSLAASTRRSQLVARLALHTLTSQHSARHGLTRPGTRFSLCKPQARKRSVAAGKLRSGRAPARHGPRLPPPPPAPAGRCRVPVPPRRQLLRRRRAAAVPRRPGAHDRRRRSSIWRPTRSRPQRRRRRADHGRARRRRGGRLLLPRRPAPRPPRHLVRLSGIPADAPAAAPSDVHHAAARQSLVVIFGPVFFVLGCGLFVAGLFKSADLYAAAKARRVRPLGQDAVDAGAGP